jgi:hypothetical protein
MSRMSPKRIAAVVAAALLPLFGVAWGQQIHRNGFEAYDPAWTKGPADAVYRETAHQLTDNTAHGGQRSEFIQLTAEQGSHIYYTYEVGRAPLSEELNASVWIKANRPGAQLLARLVLPHEHTKDRLDEPLTTLIRGDLYDLVGRWKRLELRTPVKMAQQQQQLLRAELGRDVNIADAYIDRLVLNLYGGPGLTEVWIDDLEIGPVTGDATPFKTTSRPATRDALPGPPIPRRTALVELKRDQLLVGGNRFFFHAIRYSDTPLKTLRDAGFNTLWLDGPASPSFLDDAMNLGFWVVPTLPLPDDTHPGPSNALVADISRLSEQEGILFWNLGNGGLQAEQLQAVAKTAQQVRAVDQQRPLAIDAWDGFQPYSRTVNMLGIHRWNLMTALEMPKYREWLCQRRNLAYSDTFLWTWVQTHLPDWYTNLVYDRPQSAGFNEPVGPQPEQIRLLTYTALSAGCRGLGFWSDRFLADSHQGHSRLLMMALLNQEMRLLEPMLVATGRTVSPEPTWIDTTRPEIKAAVMYTDRGVLVLPMWMGPGSQFVPDQGAMTNLKMIVPGIPLSAEPWEVSPGRVQALQKERVVGGTQVTLPEFDLTAAVVFTSDNGPDGVLVGFQEQNRRMQKQAAHWAHDLAEDELQTVATIEAELERAGHILKNGDKLLENAKTRLQLCAQHYNNGEFAEAYAEGQRALRPLRILMRSQWNEAVKSLDGNPVASPYAVSFYTLPRHWRFMEEIKRQSAGANQLIGGDFETAAVDGLPTGWTVERVSLDDVELLSKVVASEQQQGKTCLLLQISPKNPLAPPKALERTFLAVHTPKLQMQPGTLVRVSGWMRVPAEIKASVDGAMFYDSAGDEPLSLRVTGVTPWKKYTFFRRVPASGELTVTFALTGMGFALFDDVRVEPLFPAATASVPAPRAAR